MAMANMLVLFLVWGQSSTGEDKQSAQTVAQMISAYAEPESNPLTLIRAEDRCRFYGDEYCAASLAQRQNALSAFTSPSVVTLRMSQDPHYTDYLAARSRLIQATHDFASFLDDEPNEEAYLQAAASFEAEANVLLGAIVSNLYALQEITLAEGESNNTWAFTLGYVCNLILIALIVGAHSNRRTKGS